MATDARAIKRDAGSRNGRRTLTISQACQQAGVSRRTIYNWIDRGHVEFTRTASGRVRIYEDTLWKDASG